MSEESPPIAVWGLAGKVKHLTDRVDFLETMVGNLIKAVAKLEAAAKKESGK